MKSQIYSYLIRYRMLSTFLITHFQGIYNKQTNISLAETKYISNNISLHFVNKLADSSITN